MKKTISESEFKDEFRSYNRQDQFSYEGLGVLFEYLERYEEDTGEEMELDVIAICCDFTEYENLEELQKDYSSIEDMDDLENNTTVIMIDDDSFIIQCF